MGVRGRFAMRVQVITLLLGAISATAQVGPALNPNAVVTQPSPPASIIVIGFVGGFVKHNDVAHVEVQLAERLRKSYPSSAYVRIFENHHRDQAHREILRLLDADHDHQLTADERENAHIIIYGHSWGASETITLAKQLEREGIPVLLTVQVDSVSKPRERDDLVPANVGEAINYYQADGFLHGRSQIRAANPTKTRILGNFRMDYKERSQDCNLCRWYADPFMKAHLEIECDPTVWNQVESLIRLQIDPLVASSHL
jgi:hypothetical protein